MCWQRELCAWSIAGDILNNTMEMDCFMVKNALTDYDKSWICDEQWTSFFFIWHLMKEKSTLMVSFIGNRVTEWPFTVIGIIENDLKLIDRIYFCKRWSAVGFWTVSRHFCVFGTPVLRVRLIVLLSHSYLYKNT